MTGEPLLVIGIGDDGPAGLSREALEHIEHARVLAGGRRLLDFFPDWKGERLVIDADLGRVVERLKACYARQKTVVLASGDPLYYGIGRVLLDGLPRSDLVFLPHVSSVQLAFAAVKETWNDARVVSVHGRPMSGLLPAIQEGAAKIAVFTDATNDPVAIAGFLAENGFADDYTIWVCESLGGPSQRVTSWTAASIKEQAFAPLNIVILMRPEPGLNRAAEDAPLLGIPEKAFLHRVERRGLITKREVRLISLCYLELRAGDVLWDVGAGSGSVAIEAARLAPTLKVFAVEKEPRALQQLEENVRSFGLSGVRVVQGEAPESLVDLPDPDAVFIGGSGGRLRELIASAGRRLKSGGRMVINCITLESLAHGWSCLKEEGLALQATSVQLAHSRPLGAGHRFEPDSPIFILWAKKS
jgi:precorrin-6Y C5,15-methyltransferase (decarboxylating)